MVRVQISQFLENIHQTSIMQIWGTYYGCLDIKHVICKSTPTTLLFLKEKDKRKHKQKKVKITLGTFFQSKEMCVLM